MMHDESIMHEKFSWRSYLASPAFPVSRASLVGSAALPDTVLGSPSAPLRRPPSLPIVLAVRGEARLVFLNSNRLLN